VTNKEEKEEEEHKSDIYPCSQAGSRVGRTAAAIPPLRKATAQALHSLTTAVSESEGFYMEFSDCRQILERRACLLLLWRGFAEALGVRMCQVLPPGKWEAQSH
jgi:hypothetical protein